MKSLILSVVVMLFVGPLSAQVDSCPFVSLPLKEIHITSGYGMRMHPIHQKRMMHRGLDLRADYEDVFSMLPGQVVEVGRDSKSGLYISIRTSAFTISYCHLSKVYHKVDDYVMAGDVIAQSGNSGISTAPHLHLSAKKNGKAFNPAVLLELIKTAMLSSK